MKKYLSTTDLVVIIVTFVLFTLALFTKGFTHDLLLEAGVLLVSIKLILMNYRNTRLNTKIMEKLDEIKQILGKQKNE